jgi:diaminopimelate epimerase
MKRGADSLLRDTLAPSRMGIAFVKYEGLGNDFVLVEAERASEVSPELARTMCDRRFGIGADGVLLVLPPSSAQAHARMRVLNADGSIPEMCGNGLRCAAVHVARARGLERVTFETDAGEKGCSVDDARGEGIVTVDMGVVRFVEDVRLDVEGETWELAFADAGNPHAITTKATTRARIDVVGPAIATHPRFPAGTNVEFATFRGREVDLVVWERGVGVTHACGTGACATVAVGVSKGWAERNAEISVHLPGGTLTVTIDATDHAIMRGPARRVFSGTFVGPRG